MPGAHSQCFGGVAAEIYRVNPQPERENFRKHEASLWLSKVSVARSDRIRILLARNLWLDHAVYRGSP